MDGSGNETWTMGGVTLPRTWALLFACHGTGDIQNSLQPDGLANTSEITGAHAPCNGQSIFNVSDRPVQSESVIQVHITTSTDNDWQVLLIGCTNGKSSCGLRTVPSPGTP